MNVHSHVPEKFKEKSPSLVPLALFLGRLLMFKVREGKIHPPSPRNPSPPPTPA